MTEQSPKNCPNCGSMPVIYTPGQVYCEGCYMTSPSFGTSQEAVRFWNRMTLTSRFWMEVHDWFWGVVAVVLWGALWLFTIPLWRKEKVARHG